MSERVLTPELAKQMFGPRDLNEPVAEPEIEGLPAKDKPPSEWTDEESAAQRRSFDRTMRETAKRDERKQREEAERLEAEAKRTPAEQHGAELGAICSLDAKRAANAALLRSLHGTGDEAA